MTGQFTGSDRIKAAFLHQACDRLPRSEFGCSPHTDPAASERIVTDLGSDSITVYAKRNDVADTLQRHARADLFVWCLVDGPFHRLCTDTGTLNALGSINSDHTACMLNSYTDQAQREIDLALTSGADGIILGEDIGYARGLVMSPVMIENVLAPLWARLTQRARSIEKASPARFVFHSDGNISAIVCMIADAGFSGVHGLEPEAGMVDATLWKLHRQLVFWGGLSLQALHKGRNAIADNVNLLLAAKHASGASFIVGTSSGYVSPVSMQNLKLAYQLTEEGYDAGSNVYSR